MTEGEAVQFPPAVEAAVDAMQENSMEARMRIMRERFRTLQISEEKEDFGTVDESVKVSTPTNNAAVRWEMIKKVVRFDKSFGTIGGTTSGLTSVRSHKAEKTLTKFDDDKAVALEDVELTDFFKNLSVAKPNAVDSIDDFAPTAIMPAEPTVMDISSFEDGSKTLSLTVSKVPDDVVEDYNEKVKAALAAERQKIVDELKNHEADIIWREHAAQERIRLMESAARHRTVVEKQKIAKEKLRKEKEIGQQFRRVREKLDAGIKKQHAAVKETYGHLQFHQESLARRFEVFTSLTPQPVEFRIHLARAIKTKLAKGAYVLMLTQFDSLGGRPLSWSGIGSNGIGGLRPGITSISKHCGRYFDRTIRFEDSCYALCPPKQQLKPGFVFVLELFQLANRHNPHDKVVGWTAVPMAYENMTIIEGKLKLPMLKGDHNSSIQHFKDMEKAMASDLSSWLCNIYLEIRHMSLRELGVSEKMLKSSKVDIDFFNKTLDLVDMPKSKIKSTKDASVLEADIEMGLTDKDDNHNESSDPEKKKKESEKKEVENYLLQEQFLSVDKGIFRRKLKNAERKHAELVKDRAFRKNANEKKSKLEGKNSGDEGLDSQSKKAKEVLDAPDSDDDVKMDLQSFKTHGTAETAGKKKKKPAAADKTSFFSGLFSILGIGANASIYPVDNSYEAVAKSEEEAIFLNGGDDYSEHRRRLIKKWKDNVRAKMGKLETMDSSDEDDFDEVRERGYEVLDEIYLHDQQRGKLAGIEAVTGRENREWAAAGLEGRIVRRWQSDGMRFDTEAIGDEKAVGGLEGAVSNPVEHEGPKSYWQPLKDPREMDDYTMSIASDPSKRKRLMPGARSRSKLRFLYLEIFGDFASHNFGSFEFYTTLMVFLFALWLRIYIHYLAQYLFIQSLGTPVYSFHLGAIQILFKYSSASISTAAEVGIVAIGTIANLCIFICCTSSGYMFYKFAGFLPEIVSKLFAAFGVATLFDTLLILLVDLGYGNYDCSQKSDICRQNYLEDECDCFNGDFVKLWYRMRREEGSGITGLFITTIIYLGFFILALLLLYEYLVHVHKDGRILDIWRRITGPASEFYLPHDFEISEEELLDICSKASKWRGPNGARRKVKISSHSIADPEDSNDILHFKRYIISEFDPKSKKSSIFRQFTLDKDGMIVEVFENINNKVVGGIFGGLLGGQNQDGKSDSNMQIEVDEESEFDDQGSPALSPLHRGQSSRKLSENTKK